MSGAMIIGKQNRLMESFEDAGATSPVTARTLEELGCSSSFAFRRMVERGVFHEVDDERWWMDVEGAADFVRRRHRKILVFMVLAIAAAVLLAAG